MEQVKIPASVYTETLVFNAESILELVKQDLRAPIEVYYSTQAGMVFIEHVLMGLDHRWPMFSQKLLQKHVDHLEDGKYKTNVQEIKMGESLRRMARAFLGLVEGTADIADGRGVMILCKDEGLTMNRETFGRYGRRSSHEVEIELPTQAFYFGLDDD